MSGAPETIEDVVKAAILGNVRSVDDVVLDDSVSDGDYWIWPERS